MVTAAAADTLEFVLRTAVTLTVAGVGTAGMKPCRGPAAVMVPVVEFPPCTPFTFHSTAVALYSVPWR